jgi:hypothetical protein
MAAGAESEAGLSPKPHRHGKAYEFVGKALGKETVFSSQLSGCSGTAVIV